MFIKKSRQIKRILVVLFLVCFFVLCSCHNTKEPPQPEPETYSITYVINGHGTQPESLTEQTNLPDPLPVLSEDGWKFEGWYTSNAFTTGSEAVAGIELVEDITLYAKWTQVINKFSITFVTNRHGEQPENLTEQTHLPDTLPVLMEEGWKFENWYYDNETFDKPAVGGTEITEDTTLYAKWTQVINKFSITFVKNGHGWNDIENLTNQTHLPNYIKNLLDDGWIFEGWYYDNETFEKPAVEGTKLTEDVVLYAKWTEVIPKYIVEYKIYGQDAGTLIGETRQIVYRGEDTTPVTVVPNVGYKFLGWNSSGFYTDKTERVDELTRKDTNVQKNMSVYAVFKGPITCEMKFKASEGGKVEGTLEQQVLYGDKGELVTAIPDEGFRFVRWSDGQTEAVRTNECVTYYPASTSHIYAEFERYKRDFKLDYKEATSNTEVKDYTFYLDDMDKEQYLPVPKREGYEFEGWYSDWFHTIQVTDETGKTIVGKDWFNEDNYFEPATNPDMKLFAKWKPIKEVPIYKILLVYVTEIHATLESNHGGMKKIDFVMTDIERQICELVSKRTEEYLEGILNGTVDFQVDSYFTKEPLTENNFYRGSALSLGGGGPYYDYGIDVERGHLPEVNDMLDNYSSVLVSFYLSPYSSDSNKGDFHVTAGHAHKKYGQIYLDPMLGQNDLEIYFDLTVPGVYRGWIERIGIFIHELTHTIELQLRNEDFYGIHQAWDYLSENGVVVRTGFDYLYDYLRNEFSIGDRNVGIPYEFWTGEYFKE